MLLSTNFPYGCETSPSTMLYTDCWVGLLPPGLRTETGARIESCGWPKKRSSWSCIERSAPRVAVKMKRRSMPSGVRAGGAAIDAAHACTAFIGDHRSF